jgi:hypothetical protein
VGREAARRLRIKLSAVVADIFGVSGRDMLAAVVAGEQSPKALAQLTRRSMRAKITVLEEAFTGYFTDHHAFLLGTMLGRVDAITADIAALDARMPHRPHRPPPLFSLHSSHSADMGAASSRSPKREGRTSLPV